MEYLIIVMVEKKFDIIKIMVWIDYKYCVEFYLNFFSIVMFSNNLIKIVII